MIRFPSIMLTKAMLPLNAQKPWAVTTTPIQSKLLVSASPWAVS